MSDVMSKKKQKTQQNKTETTKHASTFHLNHLHGNINSILCTKIQIFEFAKTTENPKRKRKREYIFELQEYFMKIF